MDKLVDQNGIISRIRYLVESGKHARTQAELARAIGMDPSNLSKQLSGKTPISHVLINKLVADLGVSKSWLVTGEGVPYPKSEHAVTIAPEDVVEVSSHQRGVPVYDVDVTAGCMPLERMLTEDRISGFVDLPRINSNCVIVRVNGDSMEPKIIDGGFVAIRKVDSRNIFWGQIYVVLLDDYRMVKYLRKDGSDKSRVILHSENPNYDDIDIDRNEIRSLFLVESIINIKTLC